MFILFKLTRIMTLNSDSLHQSSVKKHFNTEWEDINVAFKVAIKSRFLLFNLCIFYDEYHCHYN